LKLSISYKKIRRAKVAPYTGAWIETGMRIQKTMRPGVAPYTGAWIET